MATYVPNASNTAEPISSRFVGSAAEEFRTLKTKLASDVAALNVKATQTVRAPGSETLSALPAAATRATHLPYFSATGDVAVTDFTVDQLANAIAAAYAAGSTADAVGYAPPGGEATTVQRKLQEQPSLFDNMTLAEQLDVLAGGLNYNLSAKIQAKIDTVYAAKGCQIWCPPGKYRCDSTILMRRGVTLIGPEHRIPTGSLYPTGVEGTIYGVAIFCPGAAVTTSAFKWDFSDSDKLRRPYGAQLINIMIDCASMTSGDGIHIYHLPAGEGVFNNGWAGAATSVNGVIVLHAPRYGLFCESTDNERINVQLLRSRVAFSGSHGIYCYKCLDVKIDYCFSFDNRGDGLYMDGCATERVTECDIFNNDGHGVTIDGFDARYVNNAVENNGKHGYNILASTTSITDKRYRIDGGRIGTNSYDYDNTYSNVYIGSRSGVAVTQILFTNLVFGPQAHVGTTNRVKYAVECADLATQSVCIMDSCFVVGQDRKTGNSYMNDNAMQSFAFSASIDGAGQLIANQWRPLSAWTGSFGQPNVLRGVNRFKTANTAAAMLFGFSGTANTTWVGREIYLMIDDAFTGIDFTGTVFKGNGGVDLVAGAGNVGKIIHMVCIDGTNWACNILG